MKNFWTRLSNCGLDYAKSTQDRKTIPLINRMTFVLTMLMLTFSMVGIVMGLYDILFFSVPFVLVFALTPFLQNQGWLRFARYYFAVAPVLCVCSICFYNGEGMGDKFFFFATATAPMIVLRKRAEMLFVFLMSVCAFYFAFWYQSRYQPMKQIPHEQEKFYFLLSIACIFVIIYFVIRYFGRSNEEYENELEQKNAEILEKNKDIMDSIRYAQRIQHALMASEKMLQKNLPEYFILYRPKDVVSGDFYWAEELKDGKFMMLTGDCTGHGVPGAFMSLLNISILNEITMRMNITSPEVALNTQRDAIIMSLNPHGAEEVSKDGMDCVFCSYDFNAMKLRFACANNPLWIWRDGNMMEFKPDKLPVGIHEGGKQDFTLQETELKKGDVVYTFTDGFADQFGGPGGKKYKYKKLKEKLLEMAASPLQRQKELLDQEFNSWKGDLQQVDDVLIIGVRI